MWALSIYLGRLADCLKAGFITYRRADHTRNRYRRTPYIYGVQTHFSLVAVLLESHARPIVAAQALIPDSLSAEVELDRGAFLCSSNYKSPAPRETDTRPRPSGLTWRPKLSPGCSLIAWILPASPRLAVRYCWSTSDCDPLGRPFARS